MKKFIKVALVSSALLTASILSVESFADSKTPVLAAAKYTDSSIVAEYGDVKVAVKEVMAQFGEFLAQQANFKGKKFDELEKNVQENLVKGYVNTRLLDSEVKESKIQESPEFIKRLDEIKTQVAQQFFIENIIKQKVKEADIKTEYDKMKKELMGKEEFKASHILVATEEKAKEIKDKLSKGSKFEDLAKENSMDDASKANGGELGYFTKGQLVPEFEAKIGTMKKGDISDPVKTQFGWHIIRFDDSRPVKLPALDDVKNQIQNKLARDVLEGFMKDMSRKYKVKITL
ncbi:MAG: peptidylprolyl isomerase [Rickettsiaceae bacterium]|nr:peptidylprolyl isomerase [Rickettsiaceae bacterium]